MPLPGGERRVRPPAMPRSARYAGSFDPVTNGHLDVVRQASRLCDRLVLAVGVHPGKTTLFAVKKQLAMLEETNTPIARGGRGGRGGGAGGGRGGAAAGRAGAARL